MKVHKDSADHQASGLKIAPAVPSPFVENTEPGGMDARMLFLYTWIVIGCLIGAQDAFPIYHYVGIGTIFWCMAGLIQLLSAQNGSCRTYMGSMNG
jgi:hypothetical protein